MHILPFFCCFLQLLLVVQVEWVAFCYFPGQLWSLCFLLLQNLQKVLPCVHVLQAIGDFGNVLLLLEPSCTFLGLFYFADRGSNLMIWNLSSLAFGVMFSCESQLINQVRGLDGQMYWLFISFFGLGYDVFNRISWDIGREVFCLSFDQGWIVRLNIFWFVISFVRHNIVSQKMRIWVVSSIGLKNRLTIICFESTVW